MVTDYKKILEILKQWAVNQGYKKITFKHNGISYISWKKKSLNKPNIIKIEGKYDDEIKTYLLLHELGHHQLRKNWSTYKETLPVVAMAEYKQIIKKDNKYRRRTSYYVGCVEEEFKAWDEGYKLSKEFNIKINEKKWNNLKSKCLMGYLRYYGSI